MPTSHRALGTVSPVTLNGYRGIADTHLRPALGDSDAAALTRDDVVAARNAWIAAGASGLVIGRALGYLRSAYQRAVDDGRLPRNPVSGVKAPKHQPEGRRAWSQDDARRFLAHAATDRLGALWALSLLGLRRSEVLGLQWQDWTPATDTGPGVVRVRRGRVVPGTGRPAGTGRVAVGR